jgi:hypothetical protein
MTELSNTEIIIDGILCNTKCENDRRFIGLYEEKKLLSHFIYSNIKIEHISNENQYSPYDFIIRHNELIYIIELKSRLENVKTHTYELLSSSKINKHKNICKKNSNIRCIFIFNHIDTENNNNENDYYYYQVAFNELDDICFKFSNIYQLPIRHIKSLNNFIKELK